MAKSWYVVQTYSGYEKKMERVLRQKLDEGVLDPNIVSDIKVPQEEIVDIDKDGKKKTRKNLILPGYIMVEMDLPDIGWKPTCSAIRATQGVYGFVGTKPNERPRPIASEEAKNILQRSGDIKGDSKAVRIKQIYSVGDQVKINEGPFASFSGSVDEVYADKAKLRVTVQIFGRATPVEVDLTQVEKLVQ